MSAAGNGDVKQRAAVWVIAVFVLGALLGSVAGYHFAAKAQAQNAPTPAPMNM